MSDKCKSRLLRLLLSVFLVFTIFSVPAGFVGIKYSLIMLIVGVFGSIGCLHLLEKVDRRLPRRVPTHQLPKNMNRPPSHDAVTLPTNKELWRAPLFVIPIVATPLLVVGYKFGTSPYIDWFPVIIIFLVLFYIHESIRGPLKRWWIANVFGEWTGQRWSDTKNARIIYLVDTSNAWRADTQRVFSFYGGPILFNRFWLELYVSEINVMGYLKISRRKFQELTKSNNIHCSIQYRRSKLHSDRLQLRLT